MVKHRILVVDDEPAVGRLCEQILRRAAFSVTVLSDPEVALDLLARQKFDLLLTDLRMPVIDGFELSQHGVQIQPGLATIAMTGFGTMEVAIEALRKGLDGIIIKPFDNERLVECVNQALEKVQLRHQQVNRQVLQPLIQAGQGFISETEPEKLVALIKTTLEVLLGVDFSAIYSIFEGVHGMSTILHHNGALPWTDSGIHQFILEKMDSTCKYIFIRTAEQELPDFIDATAKNWGSAMIAPIYRSKEVLVFCAGRKMDKPVLGDAEYSQLVLLARQAVVALGNARLYSEVKELNEREQRGVVIREKPRDYFNAGSPVSTIENAGNIIFRLKNGLLVDCEKRYAQRVESLVALTPSEAMILCILLSRYGQVVTHCEIVNRIQGYDVSSAEAAKIVRPLVSRLREKLSMLGQGEDWLKNVRGSGYLFEINSDMR
jgi:DNA-binding response OmpR family regulator